MWLCDFETIILILVWCITLWWRWHLWWLDRFFSTLSHNQIYCCARSIEHTSFCLLLLFIPYPSFFIVFYFSIWWNESLICNCFLSFQIKKNRKRSLSDCQHEDLDNTRDSVLSDQSHFSASETSNDPELMIIDFEYCAYNYRGFDLANHFIEWMLDYSNKEFPFFFYRKEQYPNKEQQVCSILSFQQQ